MNISWPHKAADNVERRGAARVWRVGLTTVAAVAATGAAALAAPALSAEAATLNPTTTVINMNTLNTEPSGPVMVPFTVTDDTAGGPAPTGTVTISDPVLPDQPVPPAFTGCTGTLTPGADGTSTGECQVATPVGAWGFVLMQANYSGDDNNAPSGTGDAEYKIINLMPTATSVAPATATAGKAVTLTATVLPSGPAAPSAHTADGNLLAAYSETGGDTVQFTVEGVTVCAASALEWNATTLANYATCSYTPSAGGTDAVVAGFSGDEYAAKSTGTETLTAVAATTTKMSAVSGYVGSAIKLSANVAGGATGTVKFVYGGKTLCSASLSNGAAHCTHAFGAVGSFKVEAVYEGNSTHKTSSGTATVKVTKQPTSVKVTASKATKGKAVTLTATVKALTSATGTVTFSVNGHKLCTAKVSDGKASCKYTWKTAGTYKVTASYGGNSTHLASKGTDSVKVAA
jgi:large repetitive protein